MAAAAPLVILGAGQAGGRAALTLRAEGYRGAILLLGEEPDPPYERPPLSKGFLTGERSLASFTFATTEALADAGIDFRPGCRVLAIDRPAKQLRLADGGAIAYAKLLLATGRAARPLPGAQADEPRIFCLRTRADADRLRAALRPGARLAILGGGFIGLEVAASAMALGCAVTVIELAPALLSRCVPAPLAAILAARHQAAGVRILLGTGLQAVMATEQGLSLDLGGGRRLEADALLVGIGAVPRAELAVAAGLATDQGILVDARLQTSDPDIFAAGDVCALPDPSGNGHVRLEAWQNADRQGALAARNLLGAGLSYVELPWFWSDQYELTLQIAGWPARAARIVTRTIAADACILFHLDEQGRVLGAGGVGPAGLGRDLRLAQLMIERAARPDPAAVADPTRGLKTLLR